MCYFSVHVTKYFLNISLVGIFNVKMQPIEKNRGGKTKIKKEDPYLLHHKASWVLERDIASSYVKTYVLSTSLGEVIKIEEMEDETDDGFVLTVDNSIALKQDPVLEQSANLTKAFKCDECSKVFAYKSHLNQHSLIHAEVKTFKCDLCGRGFKQKCNFNKHKLIHSEKKSFSCAQCEKAYENKSHLTTHMLTHRRDKAFVCERCKKTFTQKSSLTRHMLIHSWMKGFTFDLCKKEFTLKGNLTSHMLIHSGETAFACDIYKKTFSRKFNLNRHKLIHHFLTDYIT